MHGNPEISETLTTFFSLGTKRLLTFLTFSFSTWGERDTILTMLTVPSDPTTRSTSRSPQLASGLAQVRISPRFVQRQISTNCFFQKITKIPSPSLPGMTSFTPHSHFLSGFFIMTFAIVTSSARERELHSMCAPARALSRTKPNDKI